MLDEHFDNMVLDYLDGRLSGEQVGVLRDWLMHSRAARLRYWSVVQTCEAVDEFFQSEFGEHASTRTRFEEGIAEMLEHEQRIGQTLPLRELPEALLPSAGDEAGEEDESEAFVEPEGVVHFPSGKPQKLLEVGGIQIVRRPGQHRRRLWSMPQLYWAALIAVTSVLVVLLMQPAGETVNGRPLGQLTETVGVRWAAEHDQAGEAVQAGDLLIAGQRLALDSGFAELEMANGTRVILDGPVSVEVRENDQLYLERGRMVAHTGARAESFTVVTPTARVTDLGTEFGVEVDDSGRTSSSVFEGVARFLALDGAGDEARETVRVQAGYNASFDGSASVDVRRSEQRVDAARYVRAMPGSIYEAAILDARPQAYYRFGDLEGGQVRNVVDDAYPARLIGEAELSFFERDGERDVVRALALEGQGSYLSAHELASRLAGRQAYTIEAIVRPDAVHHGAIFSVFQRDADLAADAEREGYDQRRAAINLDLTGTTAQGISAPGEHARFIHRSPAAMRGGHALLSDHPYSAGQWLHLVTVKDAGQLRLYVNGVLVSRDEDAAAVPEQVHDVFIGAHRPGRPDREQRFFRGLLGAVAVYPHALDAQTVGEHHRYAIEAFDVN